MMIFLKKAIQVKLIVLGALFLLNGTTLFFVSNLNLGNFMCCGLGGVLLIVGILFNRLAKLIKFLLLSAVLIAVVCSSFLIIYGKNDSVTYKEDAIIVLGAAVHGKQPSLSLKDRLDTAVEYHNQNPSALIVVSGGKGQGEDITEADAMETYLLDKGVPQKYIIKESNATSTYENFEFSKQLLQEKLDGDFSVAFITNEYHIMRAGLCAKQAGIEDATHIHSSTKLSYLVSGVLRECLAVVKYAVFKS